MIWYYIITEEQQTQTTDKTKSKGNDKNPLQDSKRLVKTLEVFWQLNIVETVLKSVPHKKLVLWCEINTSFGGRYKSTANKLNKLKIEYLILL